jgi:aminoglycoside phosphotransferase (APT) family kinase protein
VLVHGDYGPNNVLVDPDARQVTAVLEWDLVHVGDPLKGLAWCEWVVRMIHPDHVDALDGCFNAYGHRLAWAARHQRIMANR